MNDSINRALTSKAKNILRIERALVAASLIFTVITMMASLYFEKTYGAEAYSFLFALVGFLVSLGCYWVLFSVFRSGVEYRSAGKTSSRIVLTAASVYFVIASLAAYAIAFDFMKFGMPWIGEGREYLYMCYFLLSVSVIFMARSVAFYWQLRSYILRSLGNLVR